jgi:hypothetical protein
MKTLQEREIKQFLTSEAKKTKYYKTLVKRNFWRYSEYPDYKSIACQMAITLMTANLEIPLRGLDGIDPAYIAMLTSAWLAWSNPTFPVYGIRRDLAEAFLHTELPSHVCAMQQSFKCALFLIPNNLIKNPDGKYCTWLFVTHLFPGDYLKFQKDYEEFVEKVASVPVTPGIKAHEHKLSWATNLEDNSCTYGNVMELPSDGERPVTGEFILNTLSDSEDLKEETKFTQTIDNLILQTMLYLQTPQQKQLLLVSDKSTAKHQTRGFDPHSPQDPIWIGADYRQRTINKPHQGGTHASPTTHWRSGHWRFIPVERGSELTKPIWIRPTIVNG